MLLPDLDLVHLHLRINHARPMKSRVIIRPMHFHFPPANSIQSNLSQAMPNQVEAISNVRIRI